MSNFLDQTGLSYFWGKIKSKFLRGNTGGVFYGTCSTAAGTVEKVVECADFTADNLKAGTIIIVTFTITNSGAVANLTMNVNGTGAKHIKCINNGTLENLSSAGYLKANTKYPFYYDGAYWVCWFNDGSEKQDKLTFDSEPTADSTNPVTSGGIKAYVDANAKYDDTPLSNRVTALENKTDSDTTYTFTADTATDSTGATQDITVTKVNGHSVGIDVPADAKFTDKDTTYTFSADKVTTSDGTEQEVTVTKVNGHAVKADVPENAVFTDTVTNVISDNIASYPDDTTSAASPYAIIMWADSMAFPVTMTKSQMDYALSNMGMATPLTYTYTKNFMANAGTMINDEYNCVNVLAMAEIINALCQQIDSNANGISAKQDALTFDSEPTADSSNPVTSAGIKAYIDKSPLASKKILIIGDSISTDSYGSYKKWVTDLIDSGVFTKSNITNNSYHATGFVRTYDENNKVVYDNFPNRLKAVTDTSYDIVVTFGGINDYIGGVKWETFTAAVDSYFSDLTSRFIDSRLVVISPLRTYNIYKNAAGHYQQEYADYIIKVARSYALPVLDLTHGSGYYPFVDTFKAKWTLVPSGYTGGDGVNPNLEYGKKYLAPLIQNFLENPLSGTYTEPANNVDMSAYYTKAEVDAAIAKAINLTVKDLTSSVKGNLGPNTTTGNVGSFFSVVRIGQLVICSLNIQMKKNSTSKLGIIYGLPKAAYPANGALSYNGYSSSVNIFIRAGESIIYNDSTIPYDGFVEGQLIYITSE